MRKKIINKTNYFLNTKANFKKIGEINRTQLKNYIYENVSRFYIEFLGFKSQEKKQIILMRMQKLIADKLNCLFDDLELNYSSFESFYWINKKTNDLIRVSNHWSKYGNKIGCGKIRTCYWTIDENKQYRQICNFFKVWNDKTFNYEKQNFKSTRKWSRWLIGVVNLSEMEN